MDETLKSLIKVFQTIPTREEFVKAFEKVVDRITRLETRLTNDFTALLSTVNKRVDDKLATVKDGVDGKDGARGPQGEKGDPGPEGPQGPIGPRGEDGKDGKDGSPDTGNEIIRKINAADELISPEAILGLDLIEQAIEELKKRPSGGTGGAKGFQLLINGVKKLLTAQTINFVPGSGVSISYSYANGRNDVTISASGSGSFAILPATGAIDGVNTTYTFASEPKIVVVSGASYRHGFGVTISTTTATLDFAPQAGSDVYGL